jgi:excisionase family DNA binding protein
MSKSDLITTIAGLPDSDPRLARLAEVLSGKTPADRPSSLRLLRVCDFARHSGLSRSTVNRMIAEKRLKSVRVRDGGSPRIPETELLQILKEAR